jgi:hypothetical protein
MSAAVILALWLLWAEWKRGVGVAALASLAFLMGVLPWMVLGPSSGSLMTQYGQRVQAVIAQRYPVLVPRAVPTAVPAAPVIPAPVPSPAATPSDIAPPATGVPSGPTASTVPPADPGVPFVVDHLLHNLVTSAMIFPVTSEFLSMREVVKDGESFWRPRWDGGMTGLSAFMLVLNLALVAFGIGTAFQRHRLRGLLPIGVLLLYLTANSLARTSGGRYVVPVDWILVAYYCVALAELVHATRALLRGKTTVTPGLPVREPARTRRVLDSTVSGFAQFAAHLLPILASVLLVGALVPLAGVLYPRRYVRADNAILLQKLEGDVVESSARQDLAAFMQQPGAVIVQGRALYPLFYRWGQGEPTRYAPYHAREYPRLVFVLIGPQGTRHVILAASQPPMIPNAADVIVLGCQGREAGYDIIHAIVVTAESADLRAVLERNPQAPLKCPLPEPVCDNNHNCY